MEFTEIPFNLAGSVYRSAMPYGEFDPRGEVFQAYLDHAVSSVVVLVQDENIVEESGRDLLQWYAQKGWRVLHLPIRDYGTPDLVELKEVVDEILRRATSGENVAIHCLKGVGRTGMVLACMAKRVFNLQGVQAIEWVRDYVPGAVETAAQRAVVENY